MKKITLFIGLLSILIACDSDSETETPTTNIDDNFNRELLLENWADNIIVPSYQNLVSSLDLLHTATDEFIQTPDQSNLTILRTAWLEAYIAWQSVEMFEIGKAEEITLRNYMNVFPLDEVSMQASLLAGNYDLSLVNRQDEQGFSALDFLLYGLANTDDGILSHYTDTENGSNYKTYLSDVVVRMKDLSSSVLDDWNNSFRDTFVANNGSSATASVNSMVNDYMFYYEKYLRAGKIGIPAGVFSGSPLIEKVEARFRADLSRTLFMSALEASQNFFNGVHFDGQGSGLGLHSYLDELDSIRETESLSAMINMQFESAKEKANGLSDDFGSQIESNNNLMLETYDELQKNVIFLKVDMFQSLNIKIDYVDADGD